MEKKIILVFLVPFFLFWHWFDPSAKKNQKGVDAYQEQKYEEALREFLSAKGLKPDMEALKSNTASTLYQVKKYKEALEEFSKIDPEKTILSKADFFYNVGNSFFKLNQFDKALDSYKKSLILDSEDIHAKKNFELTLKKIQEQKQKKEKQDQKDQQDQKDKEQDKKDQKKEEQKDQEKENQQQQQQQKKDKHENLMQYLNQNEKKQLKKKKRAIGIAKKEKDW